MMPDDLTCRAAVFPRFVKGDKFDVDTLVKFSPDLMRGIPRLKSLSLASAFLCRNEEGIHSFGERVASNGNDRRRDSGQLTTENEDVYLGSYFLRRRHISWSASSVYRMYFYWKPEGGDDRHFQIDLVPARPDLKDKDLKREERLIRTKISDNLFGPLLKPSTDARVQSLQEEFMHQLVEKA